MTTDADRLAQALYGGSTPPADPTPDARTPGADVATLFYGNPPAPAAQPEPGQLFDRFAALRSDLLQHGGEALHDKFNVSSADREADARRFVKLADTLGLDDSETVNFHRSVVNALLTAPPPAGDTDADAAAATAAAVNARNIEVRSTLREELGEAAAADVIAKTEALVKGNPALAQLLGRDDVAANAAPFLLLARHVAGR